MPILFEFMLNPGADGALPYLGPSPYQNLPQDRKVAVRSSFLNSISAVHAHPGSSMNASRTDDEVLQLYTRLTNLINTMIHLDIPNSVLRNDTKWFFIFRCLMGEYLGSLNDARNPHLAGDSTIDTTAFETLDSNLLGIMLRHCEMENIPPTKENLARVNLLFSGLLSE
ncbi:hypothetical protein M413DRAFT_28894 [Hebeloma cylindrosporum]|uniref:Uncharacterized protein n=1 Tax=Hebeloma cylindrosporum TaxID=76867 RepID=A0A0C3C7Z9_HEBCY|nr:hypothetical protein M413DRAFT_28894 [Hebeloma cylindrosporum h7]